jgi:hypothetical protein
MATPQQSLTELAAAILEVVRSSDGRIQPPDEVRAVSVADFFRYNVDQGGFAQLLYNLRGECLAEVEDTLRAAGARRAAEFYARAVKACLADAGAYREFLASDYVTDSDLKDALHGLSVEYLRGRPGFVEEAEAFVEAARGIVERWLRQRPGAGA